MSAICSAYLTLLNFIAIIAIMKLLIMNFPLPSSYFLKYSAPRPQTLSAYSNDFNLLLYVLYVRCSHNQAEQMAIVKALQEIETIKINSKMPRTILIHTDSRITLDSLKNMKNRNYLIEAIRKKKKQVQSTTVLLKM